MRTRVMFSLMLAAAVAAAGAFAKTDAPSTSITTTLAPTKDEAQAAILAAKWLTRYHYKRVALDDAMSAQILDHYVDALDADRVFFTKADIDSFNKFRDKLDDSIYEEELDPPFKIFDVYRKRVADRTAYSRSLLKTKFDFTVKESYATDRAKAPWAANPKELDDLWRRRVKNDWLRLKLAGKDDAAIRDTLDKRYRNFESRVAELNGDDVFQSFFNAYAAAIEPHTNYLGPRTAENFNISMRLSLEGIGAVLTRDDEYTVVRQIVKGGPADKTGKLKAGDRIVAVGQGDKGPMTDVIGWRLDDVVDMIRGEKGTKVRIDTIPAELAADSKPVQLTITRDMVKLESQAAKKSVIDVDGDGGPRKIGVISLPTFYHDFEAHRRGDADYRSSTRDVAKLLKELKAEKVDGVVVDLRDNGGGSLTEATQLTGLFIDEGPVVQVKDATGGVSVESDTDAGVAWDGPLAVLVNRGSASASEIFAAALQDYGRALIIGENTFGKGTVQNLVDLDQLVRNEKPRYGQLKMTVAQFFRINGGSTQHKGVVPDVAFPATWDPKDFGESALENALPWTSIEPSKFASRGDFHELLPALAAKHEARVAKDREFQWWMQDLAEYRKMREQKEMSLLESDRRADRDAQEKKRLERKAEREKAGLAKAAQRRDEPKPDTGLDPSEQPVPSDDDDNSNKTPDILLTEASRVLSDAITMLETNKALAQRVKGFTLAKVEHTN